MLPCSHCYGYYPGTLSSLSSHSILLQDWVTTDQLPHWQWFIELRRQSTWIVPIMATRRTCSILSMNMFNYHHSHWPQGYGLTALRMQVIWEKMTASSDHFLQIVDPNFHISWQLSCHIIWKIATWLEFWFNFVISSSQVDESNWDSQNAPHNFALRGESYGWVGGVGWCGSEDFIGMEPV